ncbi:transglycosylase SLT domain-containing protein [Magnetospirillum sp. UT-4]|uniref:transglycosylase SLT domain-containing protein n=1 Tax=Magnetospirillum sp. UT-4 TaxID=2681467 RepID=UPI00137C55B4|nr:transglycosylase SLT domain-containing protein [Magnetospirillum sp. UT-4]CAA7624913.1 conserved hypothetical protein [Magnetospirillum sp. UT-4]
MKTAPVAPQGLAPDAADNSRIATHIRDAAERTGVPFEYLLAKANQESGFDPDARNRRSSAMGLYQFTAGTWLEMVKNHGGDHGLGNYAEAVVKGPDGRWTVTDKALKKEILDLRRDPRVSALMAAEYAKDNKQVLQKSLGRPVSAQDLYLAHFLGAGGAIRVLKGLETDSQQEAAGVLPKAALANPELFNGPGESGPRSLDSLYRTVLAQYNGAQKDMAPVARNTRPGIDLAALRPESRPEDDAPPQSQEGPPLQVAAAPAPAPAPPPPVPAADPAPEPLIEAFATTITVDEPLSPYPVRLAAAMPEPLIDAFTAPAATDPNPAFPVRLPPPLRGPRLENISQRGDALDKKV